MPNGVKKAFRARSGISRVVRVGSEVPAALSVTVSSAWMGLSLPFILRQTCTFPAGWKGNARCRLDYAPTPPPHPFPDQSQTAKHGRVHFHFTWPTAASSGVGNFRLSNIMLTQKQATIASRCFFLLLFIRCLQASSVITLFIEISHSVSWKPNKHSQHEIFSGPWYLFQLYYCVTEGYWVDCAVCLWGMSLFLCLKMLHIVRAPIF